MRLGQIVLRLRAKNTYFENFIGGVSELDTAIKNTLTKDMAFVIPLLDDAGRNQYDTIINQKIIERFGVIVALANDTKQSDKLGFLAYDKLHEIRNQLISALCNWIPVSAESQTMYRGGKLIDMNNAYMWYQFEFEYESRITNNPQTGNVEISDTNFDDTEIPVSFNTIYVQMINTPDARIPHNDDLGNFPGEIPYSDNFPNVQLPDMANWINLNAENPNAGDFSRAFASGFDVDYT